MPALPKQLAYSLPINFADATDLQVQANEILWKIQAELMRRGRAVDLFGRHQGNIFCRPEPEAR